MKATTSLLHHILIIAENEAKLQGSFGRGQAFALLLFHMITGSYWQLCNIACLTSCLMSMYFLKLNWNI